MNENDGTRSFDTVQVDTTAPQNSPDKKPDLKKILTISIFATMTLIILLFCAIIITEVVYKVGGGATMDYEIESVPSSDSKKGDLLIINANHPVSYPRELEEIGDIKDVESYTDLHYTFGDYEPGYFLREDVIEAFNLMTDDLHSATDFDELVLDYAILKSSNPTTKPIEYPHFLGTTVDIVLEDNKVLSENASVDNWFIKNAHKYGFVNSDPDNDEHYYQISGSGTYSKSTQLRYIGIVHATAIYEIDGINTLEQYVSLLQKDHKGLENALSIEVGEQSYSIYYLAASTGNDTEIKIPKDCTYSVSGDNMGGFIITIKH